MTVIAAIKTDRGIWMGADSAGVNDETLDLTIREDRKIFIVNNKIIIGFVGSFRMGQILKYNLVLPRKNCNDEEYIYKYFVNAVRNCLREGGFTENKDGVEMGGNFIFGYNGEMYSLEADFQVGKPLDNYLSIGSGGAFALGALYATPKMTPEKRMNYALEAAEKHNAGVRRPFHISFLPS